MAWLGCTASVCLMLHVLPACSKPSWCMACGACMCSQARACAACCISFCVDVIGAGPARRCPVGWLGQGQVPGGMGSVGVCEAWVSSQLWAAHRSVVASFRAGAASMTGLCSFLSSPMLGETALVPALHAVVTRRVHMLLHGGPKKCGAVSKLVSLLVREGCCCVESAGACLLAALCR